MAHYKNYLRYEAYEKLNGNFPANLVIMYYKKLAITKAMFRAIDIERANAV
jgi:hypothetical protein